MTKAAAKAYAEKFRVHAMAIALAALSREEGALKEATDLLLEAIANSLTDAARVHREGIS